MSLSVRVDEEKMKFERGGAIAAPPLFAQLSDTIPHLFRSLGRKYVRGEGKRLERINRSHGEK